jgi:hypothetical protein
MAVPEFPSKQIFLSPLKKRNNYVEEIDNGDGLPRTQTDGSDGDGLLHGRTADISGTDEGAEEVRMAELMKNPTLISV